MEERPMKKSSEKKSSEKKNQIKKEIFEWIKIIAMAAVIALFLNTCIIANSWVPSSSMENTIMARDRLLGSRLAYTFSSQPERGDVVIFDHKAEPGKDKTRLVKRIIGMPGEQVDIRDGRVYIGQSETPLEEPYLPEAMEPGEYHFQVPEGCYLMLGDNRNNSIDARYWEDPYVPEEEIIAKVLIRYFPGIRVIQ